MDNYAFAKLCIKYSNSVMTDDEAAQAFKLACKSHQKAGALTDKDFLSWQEFEKSFKLNVPDPSVF